MNFKFGQKNQLLFWGQKMTSKNLEKTDVRENVFEKIRSIFKAKNNPG